MTCSTFIFSGHSPINYGKFAIIIHKFQKNCDLSRQTGRHTYIDIPIFWLFSVLLSYYINCYSIMNLGPCPNCGPLCWAVTLWLNNALLVNQSKLDHANIFYCGCKIFIFFLKIKLNKNGVKRINDLLYLWEYLYNALRLVLGFMFCIAYMIQFGLMQNL